MPLIRINNRSNMLLNSIPTLNPESIDYIDYWQEQGRRLVLGFWFPDDENFSWDTEKANKKYKGNKWRFCPPALYFYGNFGTIRHKPQGAAKTQAKVKMRPSVDDVEWEIYYDAIEARGFSGFELDTEYSCDDELREQRFGFKDKKTGLIYTEVNKESDYYKVQYIEPFTYLRQLFTKPLGKPLYNNGAKNYMLLATRNLGKSFSLSGILTNELIIDGRKDLEAVDIACELFVGSGQARFSTDLLRKVRTMVEDLPGGWKPNTDDFVPSPFFKEMSGSINPGNKWVHEYKVKVNGQWVNKGTGSNITHGVFTAENPEAAAGGRYTIIVIEEAGLVPNSLQIHASNDAAQTDGAWQMGSSFYIGTGGNVEKIQETEKLFRNPGKYNMLEREDEWEGTGKIGRFFPAIYSLRQFKDKNGNTDIEKCTKFFENRRSKLERGSAALYREQMNYPLKPSEMFLANGGDRFPVEDLKEIYSNLISNEPLLNSSWKVEFFLEDGKVIWKPSNKTVIREYPYNMLHETDTAVEIFYHPKYKEEVVNGVNLKIVPAGRYIASTDPTDKDGKERQNSLQSTWVYDTWTDVIVAEYTGRPKLSKSYYEQVRRLLMYYNAKNLYENNWKGLHQYFENKKSLNLLATTPEFLIEKELIKYSQVGNNAYGIRMGGSNGRASGLKEYGLSLLEEWLVSKNETYSEENKEIRNMDLIRSLGLLQELIKYNPEANVDRISALIILMIYRESLIKYTSSRKANNTQVKHPVTNDSFWDRSYNN